MVKTIANRSEKYFNNKVMALNYGQWIASKAVAQFNPISVMTSFSRGSVEVRINFRNFQELPKGMLNEPYANNITYSSHECYSPLFDSTTRVRVLSFRIDF